MKWIPSTPIEILPKDDKLADSLARRNPNVYDEKYDLVELEEWIRGMDHWIEVLEDKKVNIRMFYLTGEADIWWNTIKDRHLGLDFTYSRFLEELRAKLYRVVV